MQKPFHSNIDVDILNGFLVFLLQQKMTFSGYPSQKQMEITPGLPVKNIFFFHPFISRLLSGKGKVLQCQLSHLNFRYACVGNVLFQVTRKIITMYSFCFLSFPVNSSQLQPNLNPNQNEINSPYIPFHHECSRWFKK